MIPLGELADQICRYRDISYSVIVISDIHYEKIMVMNYTAMSYTTNEHARMCTSLEP